MERADRCIRAVYLSKNFHFRHALLIYILVGLLSSIQPVHAEGDLVVLGASLLSGARDSKEGEYLLHLQGMYELEAVNGLASTFGASILMDNQKGYVTVDTGVRSHFNTPLSPFVGIGFFISDPEYLEQCTPNQQSNLCQEPMVYGVYPEAGLHLWVGKELRVSFFARAYLSTIRGPDDQNSVYGINLAFTHR